MSERWNWAFRCYCKPSNGVQGADVIDSWYRLQDEEVQAELDAILEFFQNRPNAEWRRPKFDTLTGKTCQGLRAVSYTHLGGLYDHRAQYFPTLSSEDRGVQEQIPYF